MNASGSAAQETPALGSSVRTPSSSRGTGLCGHTVEFYSNDDNLISGLTRFIGGSLMAGDAAVLIVTGEHRSKLLDRLSGGGLNLDQVIAEGRLVLLDASGALSTFLVDGVPDAERFTRVFADIIDRAQGAARGIPRRVAAFGEMVALLIADGNMPAAISLEQLWCELSETHSFSLHCAYPMQVFARAEHGEYFARICNSHQHVIPAESYTGLESERDRNAAIAILQQKAFALENEIKLREKAKQDLHEREGELQQVNGKLQEELATMERIQQLSARLVQISDFKQLLDEVLDAALDISRADMGDVQLYDGNSLTIVSHRGFAEPFPEFLKDVHDESSACGAALKLGRRVVVEDVATSSVFAGTPARDAMLAANVRALQSTPLISHSGKALGIFSTHFREPTRPSERELRALDVLARIGTDLIERKQAEDALRHSEQRFRVLTEASPILVWMAGTDKLCYYFNKGWLEFVGRTLEQEAGNGWAENVHPDDFDRCLQIYVTNFDARRPFQMEYRLKHHTGQYRWILDCGVPRFDADGTFEGYVGGCLDITAQKEAAEIKQKLSAIVESSNDAIVSKDLNSIVTSWNKRAEQMFGYTAEEMIGKSITTIIPPELRSDEDVILAKIRSGEKIDHFETVRVAKNGQRLDVSLSISPVTDERGKIVGAAKIARDITESKRVERALRVTEKVAAAGRLAATVAHEINNPLEAITNFVFLAKTTPGVPDEVREYLQYADQELSRVAHIARQTLGFYRDTAPPSTLDVTTVVEDITAVYQRKLDNKGIRLEKKLGTGLKFRAVEGEIKQVLSNLLANAIDASNEGDLVRISSRPVTDSQGRKLVQLTVADTGEGIAPEHKPQLFNPFYTTRKDVGTGLGLWISRELIEKAGGRIRLRSRVGQNSGTALSVFLPFNAEIGKAKVA